MWNLPFELSDIPWWGWALVALGGGILASFVGKFSNQNRFAGFLAAAIAVLATICLALALFEWVRG
jgi:hypothetical protein